MPSHVSRKGKVHAPLDCSNLRRSTRANKYDGFKVNQPTDSHQHKSKVKARVVPSALGASSAQHLPTSENPTDEIPPPTAVIVMQEVGIQLCVVPADEITMEAFNKAPKESSSSSA